MQFQQIGNVYLLKAIIRTLGKKSYINFFPLSDLHIEFQAVASKQQLDLKAGNKNSSDFYSKIESKYFNTQLN